MRKRKAVLEAKQEVISEVLEDAYKAVGELDDAAYFAMLEKVLEKYVLPEEGTICFTEKDRKRMPQGYMEKVYETAKKKGGSLELTETVPMAASKKIVRSKRCLMQEEKSYQIK